MRWRAGSQPVHGRLRNIGFKPGASAGTRRWTATLIRVRARYALGLTVLLLALWGCSAGPATDDASTDSSGTSAPSRSSGTSAPSRTSASPTPTTAAPPAPSRVVVIDPGHNGGNSSAPDEVNRPVPDGTGGTKPCNTVGTETNAGYAEHAFTWAVALGIRDLLVAQGIQVVLTRPDDVGVGPCVDQRAAIANQSDAAAFVSIHADGSAAGNRGFHVITSTLDPAGPEIATASDFLAVAVRDAMSTVLPPSNYVGRAGLNERHDLAGLNLNLRPAVYVECGNMRDATDAALLTDPAGQAAIAAALAGAILAFLG